MFPDEIDSGYIPRSIKAQVIRWYGSSSKQLEHIAAAFEADVRAANNKVKYRDGVIQLSDID